MALRAGRNLNGTEGYAHWGHNGGGQLYLGTTVSPPSRRGYQQSTLGVRHGQRAHPAGPNA